MAVPEPRAQHLLAPLLFVAFASAAAAQGSASDSSQRALERAITHENRNQFAEAVREYRVALRGSDSYMVALLGIERSLHELGALDSLLVLVDSITRIRPGESMARSVQLRSLATLGRSDRMRGVFDAWRAAAPRDAAPYREYSRTLLSSGRLQEADTVLSLGESALSGSRLLALEFAQVRSALGFWDQASVSWREAVEVAEYLERAAVVALAKAPQESRDEVRSALLKEPVAVVARKILAGLELGWGSAGNAWRSLAELPSDEVSRGAWVEFAEKAEMYSAWLPMRDALLAALEVRGEVELAARAARASVSGDDPSKAIELVTQWSRGLPAGEAARWFALTEVRALAVLGRAADGEAAARRHERHVAAEVADQLRHEVAMGWVRAGNVEAAARSLAGTDPSDPGEVQGWIALYSGDLATARSLLRGYGDGVRFPGTVTAMSILGRTRAVESARVGRGFLELARGDSSAASLEFESAATELPEAASLLLATAARFRGVRDSAGALLLWERIARDFPGSAEAPEAILEWARILRARGDREGAIARLEHLILEYPGSALLPQARRELEIVRRSIPPSQDSGE